MFTRLNRFHITVTNEMNILRKMKLKIPLYI